MQEHLDPIKTSASEAVDRMFAVYKNKKIGFIDEQYWNALKFTYVRTVEDIIRFARQLPSGPGSSRSNISILEIGAFSGVVSAILRSYGFSVTAQDIPLFMKDPVLQEHYADLGISTVASNLADLPVPLGDSKFDFIVCCEVIEHLNFNILPVFRDFHRMLKPQGILYIGTPNQANIVKRLLALKGDSTNEPIERLEWQLDPNGAYSVGMHWREYTAAELRASLKMTGFSEVLHRFCHFNDRRASVFWRRTFVSAMYRVFPDFLPAQVIVGKKQPKSSGQAPLPT